MGVIISLIFSIIFVIVAFIFVFARKDLFAKIFLIWAIISTIVSIVLGVVVCQDLNNQKDDFIYKVQVGSGKNSKCYYTDNVEILEDGSICLTDYYEVYSFPLFELRHKTDEILINGYILHGDNVCK